MNLPLLNPKALISQTRGSERSFTIEWWTAFPKNVARLVKQRMT
jgi:hypothetical protein